MLRRIDALKRRCCERSARREFEAARLRCRAMVTHLKLLIAKNEA